MALARKLTALRTARSQGIFCETNPFVLFFDLDQFNRSIVALKSAFPAHWKHHFAVKANGSLEVLKFAVAEGVGMEAASLGELVQAHRAGCREDNILFDSPLKMRSHIREALRMNAFVNVCGVLFDLSWLQADNMQELRVIVDELNGRPYPSPLGLRVGAGTIGGYSTGTATSKFGVGLCDQDGAPIEEAYRQHSFLNAIMCHVGSQGIAMNLAARGIGATVDFAARRIGDQVQHVDIGGGLTVNFANDDVSPTFSEYAAILREAAPLLFDPDRFVSVRTEFGRALCAKAGFFASRIECAVTLNPADRGQCGADSVPRTVNHPSDWPLRVTLVDAQGNALGGDGVDGAVDCAPTDVAGPCCVGSDIIAHQRSLPPARSGDTVLVHDVGGYMHSSHTRYNLRQMPPVWGYSDDGSGGVTLRRLQRGETVEDTLRTFSNEP